MITFFSLFQASDVESGAQFPNQIIWSSGGSKTNKLLLFFYNIL